MFLSRSFVGALLLMSILLAACGTTATTHVGDGQSITVVAAENFWGSIAAQVGGTQVTVTSIIRDPNADPHSYEPTAADARTVADARYVIFNGVGYDPWMEHLLQANPASGRKTLNVGDFNGKHTGDNPHMWYNPDDVIAVATKIRDDLKSLDATDAATFDQATQQFLTVGLKPYHDVIAAIMSRYQGTLVGATESIFSYLAPALGLNLITPYSYLKAVSEGQDISAADEAAVEQQIAQKQIKILVYNAQNTPTNIQTVIDQARTKGIPVVAITETLTPASASFQDWQTSQLQGIEQALAQATGK